MLNFNNFRADDLINENNFIQGQDKSYKYINNELKEENVLGIKYENPETFYLAVKRLLDAGNNKLTIFSDKKRYTWNFTSEIEKNILRGSQVGVLFKRIEDVKRKLLSSITGDVLWLGPIETDFNLVSQVKGINKITFVEITSAAKRILERRLKFADLQFQTEVILFGELQPAQFDYCIAFDTIHYFINLQAFNKILQMATKKIISYFNERLKDRLKYMRILEPKTINLQKTTSLIDGIDKEISDRRYILGIPNTHFEINEIVLHSEVNIDDLGEVHELDEKLMTFDERILAFYYKFYTS